MALDFPASPSNGQVHTSGGTSWSYDGNKWVVVAGGTIEPVYIASSTPAGVDGQIYWDSDESTAYIYYTDGDGTSQWVPLTSTGPSLFDASAISTGILPALRGGTGIDDFDPQQMVGENGVLEIDDIGAAAFKPAVLKYRTQSLLDSSLVERIRISDTGSIGLAGQNYGTNGQCLTSQGGASSPEWRTPPLNNRNLVDNGSMQICQRATSVTGLTSGINNHSVDRFVAAFNASGTWTIAQTEVDRSTETFESGLDPIDFRQSFKITCTSTATLAAGSYAIIAQFIEGQDLQRLLYGTSSAKPVTLSFYVKSNKTGTASVGLRQYHSDPQEMQLYSTSYTINNANTWEYKTITIPGNTADAFRNDTDVGFHLHWFLTSGTSFSSGSYSSWADSLNANRNVNNLGVGGAVNDYFQITGIQLEIGSVATPFEHKTFGDELARCQRYFEKSYNYDVAPGTVNSAGHILLRKNALFSSITDINFQFAVSKRTNPTVVVYSPETGAAGNLRNQTDSADVTASGANIGTKGFRVNTGGIDANDLLSAHYTADADF